MKPQFRRNILKSLAVGVPASWTKPVVDNVVLPAHAETTGSQVISCGSISLPSLSFSVSCGGSETISFYYRVVSSGDTCSIESLGSEPPNPPQPGDIQLLFFRTMTPRDVVDISIWAITPEGTDYFGLGPQLSDVCDATFSGVAGSDGSNGDPLEGVLATVTASVSAGTLSSATLTVYQAI